MKILFVLEHFYPYIGGAEELFLGLTSTLAQQGHEVIVITTQHNSNLSITENYQGIRICRVKCSNRYLFTWLSIPKIIQFAKGVDFIHTTSYNAAVPAFIAGKLSRKKVIITFHEVWGKLWFRLPFTSKLSLTVYYLYEWFILKLPFDYYIAVSDFTHMALLNSGVKATKVKRIYNGFDYTEISKYSHKAPKNFVFCFFGRLGISKGLNLLLEATQQFTIRFPETTLKLIIPTYPPKLFEKVKKIISERELTTKIIMLNDLSKADLRSEIIGSSCTIIPSLSEGFCFAAAESVAMNVPVISSGKGALREVVGGKHIHLKEITTQEILIALERAMKNQWDYAPMKKFDLETSVKTYLELYSELMKSD